MSRHSTLAWCLGLVCLPLAATAQSLGDDAVDAPLEARESTGRALEDEALDASGDAHAIIDRVLEADAVDEARVIIDRALEQAARQRAAAFELDFEYFTDGLVESLDGDGRVTRVETTRNRHYPVEGHFYSEIIARDGRPLDEGTARDERERKADFVREARRHADGGERYAPDEMRVDFDHDLMDRYVTTLAGTDVVGGRVCWVIRFEPREGKLPDGRRLDKAMNRSSGRLWIAQHDYGVRRAVFEMQRPFRWLWGIAGTLRRATGRIDFRRVEPNLWIPDRTLVEIELGVFFGLKTIRRRIRNEWVEPPTPEPDGEALLP